MSKYDQRALDELTAALAVSFRAEAQAQREAGQTGLSPELVAAYAAGTLDERAKAAVDRLAQGNPLAMEQLADAIAALPEPVPVPSVVEVWLARAGRAAADVVARVQAYVQAHGEAAVDRLMQGWQVITQPPVRPLAEGAAFAGGPTDNYYELDEIVGLRPSLRFTRGEAVLYLRGDTLDYADTTFCGAFGEADRAWPFEIFVEGRGELGVGGSRVLGRTSEFIEVLGTVTPRLTWIVPNDAAWSDYEDDRLGPDHTWISPDE